MAAEPRRDPDGDGHAVRRLGRGRRSGRDPRCCTTCSSTAPTASWCAGPPAKPRRSTTTSTSASSSWSSARCARIIPDATVIAGVGSNDTRHAVQLTEGATELRPDALLAVNPYYNRPSRRGIIRALRGGRPGHRPADPPLQHPAADRLAICRTTWLPSLRSSSTSSASSRPTRTTSPRSTGSCIYAGNDDLLADVLDLGEPGGILTGSHLFGEEMRRMVDEPEQPPPDRRRPRRTSTATWRSRPRRAASRRR